MNGIRVEKFYGGEGTLRREGASRGSPGWIKKSRKMPSHILGPRDFWMEFDRQADALDTAAKESKDFDALVVFVYQRDNGYRKFVVAHPERYWWHYEHRPPDRRCSYEVIPENHPCRLYLDLEYPVELNGDRDGSAMTDTVIKVFCAYLLARWALPCSRYDVIDLDSSTEHKFSRHLIFNLKYVAFRDNEHLGRLVKSVCKDIVDYVSDEGSSGPDVLGCFDRRELEQLLVRTNRGKRLFVDTAVYTRNRHFRIYGSTKWGKRSNLVVSRDCKYIPSSAGRDRESSIFLDSLVSYFETKRDLILLECPENGGALVGCFKGDSLRTDYRESTDTRSKYPALDAHVRGLIFPGKIRACKYFEAANVFVYETVGYRYCENIGRCHKSNNVFWIVDPKRKVLYQKCHDEDCFGFKSRPRRLPEEVCFRMDEDEDDDDALLRCAIAAEVAGEEMGSFDTKCFY